MAVQLRLHARQLEESLASPPREQARERGKQGAIGRPEQGRRSCRPSTASWWRKTSNSTSLAKSLRRFLTSNRSTAEKAR
jgi:hypothetical protein